LFQSRKQNIERICEDVVDADYSSIQHFISESPWDARAVMNKVAGDSSKALAALGRVGLLIDESSHLKKGDNSVGVSRQYAGCIGKVDNCQVAVYGALSTGSYYQLIDCELYLPKIWTEDRKRCKKAGVPEERMSHQSKSELALEIVKRQLAEGTHFDWVGADGLYGNDSWLLGELDALDQLFVIDIHSDQRVYINEPEIAIPVKTNNRGRTPSRFKTNSQSIEVRQLLLSLPESAWEDVHIRNGTSEEIKAKATVLNVYAWDGKSDHAIERKLIIRKTKTKNGEEIKYSFSNAFDNEFTLEELVRMQAQRYFIEQSFRDAKQEVGMSKYQVRGWLAWHHHMAMVMMATQFILFERLLHKEELPLLSAFDVREIIMHTYANKKDDIKEALQIMKNRHRQRAPIQDIRIKT